MDRDLSESVESMALYSRTGMEVEKLHDRSVGRTITEVETSGPIYSVKHARKMEILLKNVLKPCVKTANVSPAVLK